MIVILHYILDHCVAGNVCQYPYVGETVSDPTHHLLAFIGCRPPDKTRQQDIAAR